MNTLLFCSSKRPVIDWPFCNEVMPSTLKLFRSSTALTTLKDGGLSARMDDCPRLDYLSGIAGLLREEQRTNLLYPSEEFSHELWGNGNALRQDGQVMAIDGTTTGAKIAATAIAYGGILRNYHAPYSANTTYAGSIYIKKGNHPYVGIALGDQAAVYYNLDTQTLIKTTGTPVSYALKDVGNGWFRMSLVATQPASPNGYFDVYLCSSSGSLSSTFSGTEFVYLWGAQLEAGSFITSYIQTISAAATRAADHVSAAHPVWLNPCQGTILMDAVWLGSDATYGGQLFWIDDGSPDGYISCGIGCDGKVGAAIYTAGSWTGTGNSAAISSGQEIRIGLSYKKGCNRLWVNGTPVPDSAGFNLAALPSSLSRLRLFENFNGGVNASGWLRRLRYWPWAMEKGKLKALTE